MTLLVVSVGGDPGELGISSRPSRGQSRSFVQHRTTEVEVAHHRGVIDCSAGVTRVGRTSDSDGRKQKDKRAR